MKIALDIDGILANFYKHFSDKFNLPYKPVSEYGLGYPNSWWLEKFELLDNNFWETIPVLNSYKEIKFDFDIYLTAMPQKFKNARISWLSKNNFPDKPLHISEQKVKFCLENNINVLIDDKLETVNQAASKNIFPIQYIPPYYTDQMISKNPNVFKTKNLSEIPKILNYIKSQLPK